MTALGNDLYWLTDGRDERPREWGPLHRVERLDTETGHVSIVADSGAGQFTGLAAGADAVAVVLDRPAPRAECGDALDRRTVCVSPLFEAIQPDGRARPLATSEPQPQYAEGGYSIDQTMSRVLFQSLHQSRRPLASWTSTGDAPRTVLTDAPFSAGITTVGNALVGQYFGENRLWSVGGPPLPGDAARGGLDPTGAANHLAWFTQTSASDEKTVYVATVKGHAYTTPVRVTSGRIYVMQFATDCLLYLREVTGLFVAHVCRPGAPTERLLTAEQADQIYDPARFAFAPGRFAFAVKERDAEVVVLLQTPTS